MNFLANENFPLFSITLLRDAGHNVVGIIEDAPGSKDIDILQQAQIEKRIILTFDRDYGEMIYRHESIAPAGIVFFRFNPSAPEEPARILLRILREDKISIMGKFTVVERGRIRQRVLSRNSSE
ncbi:MAG: DUF5615 family PIN-like protein [Actinobacteria bacterium]|nr:DUF5615 family PIN-like protein [Actinomycetota bacterium]